MRAHQAAPGHERPCGVMTSLLESGRPVLSQAVQLSRRHRFTRS
jgi:hypothetical protein